MNKRGLSDIVATILIVLLALAAVGIVAGFLLPIIRDSGSSAALEAKCLDSEVEIVSCVHDISDKNTTVLVRMARGDSVSDVVVAVDFLDGSTKTERTGSIALLATDRATIIEDQNATTVRAYPVISGEDVEHVCKNPSVHDCVNQA